MLQQNTRYSYTYNRVWLTIYRNDTEVAMLQCSEAHCLADALEVAPDYIQQSILSQYDYTTDDVENIGDRKSDESVENQPKSLYDQLERLIDEYSLSHLLGEICDICGDKEWHLKVNWQDRQSAKAWAKAYTAIHKALVEIDC
jgi:hypothetical protein